jgi:hypothetical protein
MRVMSASLIATLMVAGLASPATAAGKTTTDTDAVRLDVGLDAGTDPEGVLAVLGDALIAERPIVGLDAIAVDVSAGQAGAALSALAAAPGVRYAERGGTVAADSDDLTPVHKWAHVPEAWSWTTGDPRVTIAVVDSGVTPTDEVPAARHVTGYDFADRDDDPADADGHGTLVAGVIAGDNENGGPAGMCPACTIMPIRVLTGGKGSTSDTAAGIAYAADNGARIINLSLSTGTPSRILHDAVAYASAKGSLVVASAGNVKSTARRYPAAYEPAIAVKPVNTEVKNTESDRWVDLSSTTNAVATGLDGEGHYLTGSSGAAAALSGAAALGFAIRPEASATELRTALEQTAFLRTGYPALSVPLFDAAAVVHRFGGADTEAPVLTDPGLKENQLVGLNGVSVKPLATDDHGVQRLELQVPGQDPLVVQHAGYSYTLRPHPGLNGPTPVTVVAYDYEGRADSRTVIIEADTKRPSVTMVSPVATSVAHGTVAVTLSVEDTDVKQIYSIWSGPGGQKMFMQVPGTKLWKATVYLPESGEILIAAEDKAGNRTDLTRYIHSDNAPPAGGTITPANGAKVRGTFTTKLTGVTDLGGVAKAELWANGKHIGVDKAAPFSLSVKTGSYSGKYTLVWKVTDRFGQARTLPTRTLTADNKAPTVTIAKAPKNGAKVSGTVKVYTKASDTNGIARVELIINGKVVAKDTTSGYVLSVNTKKVARTMKVQVRAYDKVGNLKTTATRTWRRK